MKTKFMKTLGVVMAAVLCFGMTALAAPSPSGTGFTGSATDKSGNAVTLTVSQTFSADEQTAVDTVKTADGLKAILGSDYNENMVVQSVINVSAPEGAEFPLTISFPVAGVTSSSKVQILHWNGSAWEKIATTVGNGTASGTFNSLSPVAFVVDKTTAATGTSPKTGAATTTATVALLGLCAAVAAFGFKKRSVVK